MQHCRSWEIQRHVKPLANSAQIGGYSRIMHHVNIGLGVVIHQNVTIGPVSMIGMGSVILDGAEIGEFVLIGAGSLVTQGTKIPSYLKAFGRPAKVVGKLTDEEIEKLKFSAGHYVELARTYRQVK